MFKEIFKKRLYTTPSHIKEEFVSFLEWYTKNKGITEIDTQNEFDKFVTEKDFAYTGELRKIKGTNTRNSTLELVIALGAVTIVMLLGLGISILIF